jgi:glycosyltransferase involved in cell wall biosynthesis
MDSIKQMQSGEDVHMARVSVVLTSFNHGRYIREAIDSVLAQTFADFELIIWDDASSDDSWHTICSYSDPRIKAFRNEVNKRPIFGVIKTISEVATGEFIAMHHSDDVWLNDKLEKQLAYLDSHPETGAVFSNALAIADDSLPLADENHFYSDIFNQPNRTRHEWLRFFFCRGNALCHPSVLIRKSCYAECGLYRYGFAQVGDLDMWIRLCLKYEIHVLPERLVKFRVRDMDANTSAIRPDTRSRGYFEYYRLLSNYLSIDDFDDLSRVFPESRKFYRGDDSVIEFALAMAALEIKPFHFAVLFGLNVLFDLISDPAKRRLLANSYGFGYSDFIRLTGEYDPFQVLSFDDLAKKLAERDGQIAGLTQAVSERDGQIAGLTQAVSERDGQIAGLTQAVSERDGQIAGLTYTIAQRDGSLQAMKQSNSWKITAPLRAVSQVFKGKAKVSEEPALPMLVAPGADAFFTICSKNFLAHARVLYNSVHPHYPNARFFVALCDRVDSLFDPAQEPFEFVFLEDLNLPNLGEMAARYNITEFNTAVKPFAFAHLMTKFGFGSVVYLDPDLFFVDKMDELDKLLHDGAEAVLTPHILQPAEHDEVHDGKMLLFGIYNLGFLALRNTPAVLAFLSWWGRRLERDCVIRLEEGLFVDQKWADLLPAFVPGTRVIHHPGYNVAYWNLPQRMITRRGDRWFANGEPLRFVHFSGNKLDDVNVFSRHSQQVTIESIGDLRELLDTYREQVYQQGHAFYRALPYAYSWNGEAGVNLHTPKELDLASPDALPATIELSSDDSHISATGTQPGSQSALRRRVAVLRRALPVGRQLSGGWLQFARRTWRAYRKHGWHYVKAKGLELSGIHAPAPTASQHIEPSGDTTPAPTQLPALPNGKTKRLLYIDWGIPKPDQDAASVTAKILMEVVDSLGYKVTFVPAGLQYEEGYYEDLVAANIDVLVSPAVQSVSEWLTAYARNFDVCIMARAPVVWPYLVILKNVAPNLRLIFNTVDLHYIRELRQAELANDAAAREAALVTRAHEFELMEKCDLTILLSQEEMYAVREIKPEAPVVVLPVVFTDIPGATKPFAERRDILFIGSFPHQPNIDAVYFFVAAVFPIIRQRIPDIKFKVIGSSPPDSIRRLAEFPGIEILGFVKDLEPVFSDIRLSVAPLRYGAGIKGKIGTSFCYGVPCVATSIAAEGMGLTNGKNVLIGDTPEQLAEAVCAAYLDVDKWNALSKEGHRFALENYSVPVIRERVSDLLWAVTKGWQPIHSAMEIDGWDAFQKHSARLAEEYDRRVLLEQSLLPTDGSESFTTPGYCCVCGQTTSFLTSFMYSTGPTPDGRPMPNWREHMQCEHCGLVNRMRAALNVLHTSAPPQPDSQVYITERLTHTYRWLEHRYCNLQGSEYFGPTHQPGANVDGIRHEDVMNLSFSDAAFDRVLSFDVLEHVPEPDRAYRELYRVLKPGGVLIFSVPFSSTSQTDIVRATLGEDGTIVHHLPAEYHGNPVDPEGGALCFRYFGWDMLDRLRGIGFKNVRCLAYWSEQQGYLGKEQYLFIANAD